ncbi:MarR family transcriptional regulator [Neobacillus sp. MM2021_6]|uniref:MarR family winged helix-turn-helix transcriptional regulator n=1 Tax=Bacillaceae TaxID=186817 RepID=UPI001408ED8F|nr:MULTISPECIES: MarR family transcriptional regulator [Bacillaceae]MBO0962290.1 MarR family transcriptional regulator [Neobacillus sp. MM2021_6]NHC19439.1 MarR family transcriptional regulator [Bacillus sp. MM2020_4]
MEDVKTNMTLDFFRLSNLLGRYGAKMVADVGLTSIQQWVILRTIITRGDISIGELKEEMLVTKQNMTGMIYRLQQSNLVTLFQDHEDKRRTRVKITEEGIRVYEQLKTLRNDFNAQTYHIYSDQEIMILSDLLGRLVDHLKEGE